MGSARKIHIEWEYMCNSSLYPRNCKLCRTYSTHRITLISATQDGCHAPLHCRNIEACIVENLENQRDIIWFRKNIKILKKTKIIVDTLAIDGAIINGIGTLQLKTLHAI